MLDFECRKRHDGEECGWEDMPEGVANIHIPGMLR